MSVRVQWSRLNRRKNPIRGVRPDGVREEGPIERTVVKENKDGEPVLRAKEITDSPDYALGDHQYTYF